MPKHLQHRAAYEELEMWDLAIEAAGKR